MPCPIHGSGCVKDSGDPAYTTLTPRQAISAAPYAIYALGASLSHLGHPISDPYRAPLPAPHHDGAACVGEVIYVDRFGTLISNIPGDAVEPGVRIRVAGTEIGTLARTFGEVKRGVLVALVGSGGTVEIAVRDGSAARLLGVGVGAEVRA